MSSPIGHSLAGLVVAAWREKSLKPRNIFLLALFIVIANGPDFDFIPGILNGTPNLYHHGISHSLGMALCVSVLGGLVIQKFSSTRFNQAFITLFALYGSHLVLDLLSVDGRPPYGIPLFWPVSEKYFMFPLLPPVLHSQEDYATIGEFFADIFSAHNLYVIGLEVALTLPFAFFFTWYFRRKRT